MFTGIIPPLVSPLREDGTLDQEGLARLVEHVVGGGVDALFVLGTTGEGPALSPKEQRVLVAETCRLVGERRPVLVGVTHPSYQGTIDLARQAAEHGAAAVVLAPPPYFVTTAEEVLTLLARLAADSPLPVILYNMPANTHVALNWRVVRRALEIPGVVGFKDSSGDMVQFHKVREQVRHRPDFSVMLGPEELLADSVLAGAHGGVSGGANLFPRLYAELYRVAAARQLDQVTRLHRIVIHISERLYELDTSGMRIIRVLKAALARQGICGAQMAFPFGPLGREAQSQLESRLEVLQAEVADALLELGSATLRE